MTRTRTHAGLLAVMAVAVVAALTLAPRMFVAPAHHAVNRLLATAEVPLANSEVEVLLNILMFVPVGAALVLLLPRWAWWVAILAGATLSAGVEYLQASIPGRVPDLDDVMWNTTGTVIGVLVAGALRAVAQRGNRTRT